MGVQIGEDTLLFSDDQVIIAEDAEDITNIYG